MSVKSWFEDRQKFGGLIGAFFDRATKGYIPTEEGDEHVDIGTNKGLWTRRDNRGDMLYVRSSKENDSICEGRGYHLPMTSTERIEPLIDRETRIPLDEDMTARDILDLSDEDSYQSRITTLQENTGSTDAVQTGIGRLNGKTIALGVMDLQSMGGSMGSVVGEKITRLVECATTNFLPLVIVCAPGGARMQEGTSSLMQMAKIPSASQTYQVQKKLLYISILTYPTTGGATASSGMLGDLIIAEPKAYTAFAGKRVIEQTLRQKVPDGFQVAESLFDHGSPDLIVPRNLLKGVLSEISELYTMSSGIGED
uniref:acetyl-CoA carboxylase carboxyltransferase beta subunit n=1 Tax=Schizaea fistulosa TaxID=292911 RepID=UPI0021152B47|nr:acetyl-CoA carboxylase carboxyltransferase beta subunit [Schizaea fistulosa]UTJ90245.1 acetyl-CoA carboxylase carboxyltransferase beta subunit [Schizaea fistulosa]